MPMARLYFLVAALAAGTASAQVFPEALPANRAATGSYSPRILSLGEPRFTDAQLYNLLDQGGSPMGLFEMHQEKVSLGFGYSGTNRSASGDSLSIEHQDLVIPNLGFFQPGVFGASLYYLRESEAFRNQKGDSLENHANLFGLDLAAGPASGLFRFGFGAQARLGGIDYSRGIKRVLVSVPSLRFDLGSRLHPAVELGLFAGLGGQFDSLQSPAGYLERVASFTLPRYGVLADLGGTEDFPAMGNIVLELGTQRLLGEYKWANGNGIEYPTLFTDYWTLQTQWMYPIPVHDFTLRPAVRFAHRSEKAQGYEGLKGNQNPFKKGAKIDSMALTRGINDFGLGAQVGYQEMVSLILEWETSGHTYKSDTSQESRYNRFSLGLENKVHKLPISFPDGMSLTLRTGWTWRQDAESQPGYRTYHFQPFLPSPLPAARPMVLNPKPDAPANYSAFSLGASLGLFEESLGMDGLLSFPSQKELRGNSKQVTNGSEFSVNFFYRLL